jgi:DNA-binding NarL/FixJ family response regulator
VLSSSKDAKDVALAIEFGAAGYLSKDMQPADLMDAVGRIAGGETLFERDLLDRVLSMDVENDANNDHGLIEPLTEQEFRVLILLSNGMSNPEIASVLTLSANTIKTHVRHIFEKIGVSDRTSAALWAAKMGLFPPGSRAT